MKFRFAKKKLGRLYHDREYTAGLGAEVIKAFRKRLQIIASAKNERDFYALKSLHYEKLKGKRSHQRSMRLNDQWRLVLEIEKDQAGNVLVIIDIEDYH